MFDDRILWIDLAKGIAILLVVLGHVAFLPMPVLAAIYSFHMPLFFFLSGVLLFRKKEEFNSFLLKKSRTLIWPYYIFLCIQSLAFYPAYKWGFKHIVHYLPGWPSLVGMSELWFLYSLFFIQLFLFPIYSSIGDPLKKQLVSILLIIVVCLLKADCINMYVPFEHFKGSTLPFGLDLLFLGGSFVMLGIMFRNYLLMNKVPIWLAGACLIIAIICGIINYRISGNSNVEFSAKYVGNPIFFYLSAISSIIAIIALCQRLPACQWLDWCGRYSLAIYAIHWVFVPFVIVLFYNHLLPLRSSLPYITACCILAFLCILLPTIPLVWLVEKKIKWMLGR